MWISDHLMRDTPRTTLTPLSRTTPAMWSSGTFHSLAAGFSLSAVLALWEVEMKAARDAPV